MATSNIRVGADRQSEMLVVLTTLTFIENHNLMPVARLNEAKRSIMALFIHSSGEEMSLRKLLDLVSADRDLHIAFGDISAISKRIDDGARIVERRVNYLKTYLAGLDATPEENQAILNPFVKFCIHFQDLVWRFNLDMERYLDLREREARRGQEFRIAHAASERLRQRLAGVTEQFADGPNATRDESIKDEVIGSFDYEESERRYETAAKQCKAMDREINAVLADLKAMCQMAMNPDMRDAAAIERAQDHDYDDVFALLSAALKSHPRLNSIKDFIVDYFRMFQRSHGMFQIDYENFCHAAAAIANNAPEYFDAKHEDHRTREQREKIRQYEGVIPFLENAMELVQATRHKPFSQFSRTLSDMITASDSPWLHIGEGLLIAKVTAESDLTTRPVA